MSLAKDHSAFILRNWDRVHAGFKKSVAWREILEQHGDQFIDEAAVFLFFTVLYRWLGRLEGAAAIAVLWVIVEFFLSTTVA